MEFRLAKERRRQIEAEAEETKAAVTALNESLITASLEVNTARTLNRALIDDIEDVIGVFFGQLKASKVNMASADSGFAASFEADGEWRSLAAQLAAYRDWTVEAPSDELVREVAAFGTRFQEKFVDFKHRLLKHLSAFKGTASIEVICERQKLARELETDRQRLAEEEAALGALVAEKERTEEEGEAAVGRLNEAVHQAKVAIVAAERAAEALAAEVAGLEEAAERAEAEINAGIVPAYGLAQLSSMLDIELTEDQLDEPLPHIDEVTQGNQSRFTLVTELARREQLTVRQLIERLAGGRGHRVLAGTPEQIADDLETWFTKGAADGFNIMPPTYPQGLEVFVDTVVPILQQRGLFRTEYTGTTLREHYGLARPSAGHIATTTTSSKEQAA